MSDMTREEARTALGDRNNLLWGMSKEERKHYSEALDMAISALSTDVRPNIHGHWKVLSDGYGDNAYICECSECKDTVWVYKDADRKWNFCPFCGADMREPKGEKGTE